jgi:importin-7
VICAARQALEDTFQEDSDDEDIIDDAKLLNLNEEEGMCPSLFKFCHPLIYNVEDVWDEDSAYLEMLAKEVCFVSLSRSVPIRIDHPQGARLREKSEKIAEGEDIEDSEDEEDEVEEELGYISPLDKVNPYSTFKQALTSMSLHFCRR